jgi:hypothetical protein
MRVICYVISAPRRVVPGTAFVRPIDTSGSVNVRSHNNTYNGSPYNG